MDWIEKAFQKAERWIIESRERKLGHEASSHTVYLEEIQPFLTHWCSLWSGRSWSLQEAEAWGGRDEERLFFPAKLDLFQERKQNERAYLYLACYLLGFTEKAQPELTRWRREFFPDYDRNRPKDQDFHGVALLIQEGPVPALLEPPTNLSLPTFRSLLNLWVTLDFEPLRDKREPVGQSGKQGPQNRSQQKKKTRHQIEIIDGLNDPKAENPLVHSFEKLHTTDDYKGGQKNKDGEDELSEHEDSLEELDLRQLIRTPEQTKAQLKGDYALDIDVAEAEDASPSAGGQFFYYDEWKESSKSYLKNWCRLEERKPPTGEGEFDVEKTKFLKRRQIEETSRTFYSLFNVPFWKTRQAEGSDLDLDAAVDYLSTPLLSCSETARVYLNQNRRIDELALVLLFDRSLSSDSWVQDKRILDTIKESLVILGESLGRYPLQVQLASFSSVTRNRITYDVLKSFDEPWKKGFDRLVPLEPHGYTRLGPALRHARRSLEAIKSRHKWILLLSDAKPTDYDRYEGRYGVRDVRKAVAEIRQHQIGIKCLSIENLKRPELSEMFGPRGYELLPRPADLPARLAILLRDLVQHAR